MDIGDLIMWLLLLGGCYAIVRNSWPYIVPYVSGLFPPPATEITSSSADAPASEASRPRTDETADGRTKLISSEPQPATIDTARSLRAHGYTRDEARALLKTLGWSLGNDTWSRAQPLPDDEIVTPYAGRRTRASYYPDDPTLEYQPPR